ncbi:hypothetical protein H318_11260 [Enterococcus durans IPLA 655]|nr:hypothetical protein H318_11260 [Enterococcus durans IPLA 655]
MNKQELIDKWESKTGAPSYEISDLPIDPSKIEMYIAGYGVARKEILEDLKQLDEPKKLIVKPIVAGWIEKSTDNLTKAEKIAYLIKSKDGDSYYFCDWFVRDGILTQEQGEELLAWATRQSYETLLSLYNGYEVEKEPLYSVIIAGEYLVKEISCSNEVKLVSTAYLPQYLAHHYQLTEKQIKEIDERYWPFAVPVEEVVER